MLRYSFENTVCNPAVFAEGRLPAHADFTAFRSEEELEPTRLLWPWDFLGKTTGVGCHFLLQGIFPTLELNPHLLRWQVDSLPLSHLGSPCNAIRFSKVTAAAAAKSLQSCPTLCDPIDGSPPGSPVPGILQARTLEWGAIAFFFGKNTNGLMCTFQTLFFSVYK